MKAPSLRIFTAAEFVLQENEVEEEEEEEEEEEDEEEEKEEETLFRSTCST